MPVLRCIQQRALTDTIYHLSFEPADATQVIDFLPGQYLEFLWEDMIFPCSFAHPPASDHLLHFYIRRDPTAQHLIHTLTRQPRISVSHPKGHNVLSSPHTRPLLCVAGGTGITPHRALIMQAVEDFQGAQDIVLYWGVKETQDFIFHEQWMRYAEKHRNFTYVPCLSSAEDPAYSQGLVHQVVLKKQLPLAAFDIYVSGPYDMVQRTYQDFHAQDPNIAAHFFSDMPIQAH